MASRWCNSAASASSRTIGFQRAELLHSQRPWVSQALPLCLAERRCDRRVREHVSFPVVFHLLGTHGGIQARYFARGSHLGRPSPRVDGRNAPRPMASAKTPPLDSRDPTSAEQSATKSTPQRFEELPLSEATQRALQEHFGFEMLSDVQAAVLPRALSHDSDLFVRAHTGTGKTLAFLIPAVERLVARSAQVGQGVGALVVAPTRELAMQIGTEAETLLSAHGLSVVTLVGGANKPRHDQLAIRRVKPSLIVGTPGRLLEHFERTFLFSTLFKELDTLVLDEADRLLDMGFVREVKEILAYLPVKRRSMLFSATLSESVIDVARGACRGRYDRIDCVGDAEADTTNLLDQSYAVLPGHQCMGALYNLLMAEMSRDQYAYKIIVFFPTARLTAFMAQFFRQQVRLGVYEIHRRREAEARLATQTKFKNEASGIIFSSDLSARGMDYPNVTLVIQFGAPATRELYVHRVGRTARAGKEGRAVLLLGELEVGFLQAVEDLPLKPYFEDGKDEDQLRRVNEILVKATSSWIASAPLRASATAAFASMLVHYKSTHRVLHMSDDDVIQAASDILLGCGLVDQPVVHKRLAIMLGLEKHPGLQCAVRFGEAEKDDLEEEDRRSSQSEDVGQRTTRRRAPWKG